MGNVNTKLPASDVTIKFNNLTEMYRKLAVAEISRSTSPVFGYFWTLACPPNKTGWLLILVFHPKISL